MKNVGEISMVVKCPNCDAALLYNPASGKMECLYCQNEYEVEEVSAAKEEIEEAVEETMYVEEALRDDDLETMECNVYACTSCGAELAVNGVESSTFCAYCGQPTVIFSRVSATKKPKYIIPFSVTKEEAVDRMRKELLKGFFVPRNFRKFEIEKVRGIYIPYWIYDINYEGRFCFRGEVPKKIGKGTEIKYFYREAKSYFHNIALDASLQLNDDTSRRLEPYDLSGLKEFDMSYLSGFYADCYDLKKEKAEEMAITRGQDMYLRELLGTIPATNIRIFDDKFHHQIKRTDYVMFPAWFLTLRYRGESYTILTNGQNGKVIGAIPYDKIKAVILTIILGLFIAAVAIPVTYALLSSTNSDGRSKLMELILMIPTTILIMGVFEYRALKSDIKLTKSKVTKSYVEEREDNKW